MQDLQEQDEQVIRAIMVLLQFLAHTHVGHSMIVSPSTVIFRKGSIRAAPTSYRNCSSCSRYQLVISITAIINVVLGAVPLPLCSFTCDCSVPSVVPLPGLCRRSMALRPARCRSCSPAASVACLRFCIRLIPCVNVLLSAQKRECFALCDAFCTSSYVLNICAVRLCS